MTSIKNKQPEAKARSRLLILNHIMQFSLAMRYGDLVCGGLKDMAFLGGEKDAQPGDLVALNSAPPSKWYLGWLVSRQFPEGHHFEQFSIESIEDGQICNWSNVGLIYYDRSQTSRHPEWRWTDKQHQFHDRWEHCCHKVRDAYLYLPTFPVFTGDAVQLGVRVRFGLSKTVIRKDFPNWRKVTRGMMLEFYDEASAELEAEKQTTLAPPVVEE